MEDVIAKVSYTHDAMIDLIIARPEMSQTEIAGHFGFTNGWISRVINSDTFQARLAARKQELVDPGILASIDEKLKAATNRSLDIVMEKLNQPSAVVPMKTALDALDLTLKAQGYGARGNQVNVQQNFVVALPPKSADSTSWAKSHGPQSQIIDVQAS